MTEGKFIHSLTFLYAYYHHHQCVHVAFVTHTAFRATQKSVLNNR